MYETTKARNNETAKQRGTKQQKYETAKQRNCKMALSRRHTVRLLSFIPLQILLMLSTCSATSKEEITS